MDEFTAIKRGRKFEQVVAGARDVFLTDGFEGASVDTIARRAGVSKATLYAYFPDKRLLFMEIASSECRRQAADVVDALDLSRPPREVLERVGSGLMQFMLSDCGQRVFRICVAEADRFPDLGRHFWNSGPMMIERTLCDYFTLAIARGELRIADLSLAAHQFAELCKSELFPKMVFGLQRDFAEDEIARVLQGAIDTFMARYGT